MLVSLWVDSKSIFHSIDEVLYVGRVEATQTDATALHEVDVVPADQVLDLCHWMKNNNTTCFSTVEQVTKPVSPV